MIVLLLGPPGVGKGTQGVLLEDATGWRRIVTGDLLRTARREGTPLGRRAKRCMDAGNLVPDDLIVALVEEQLRQAAGDAGLLFDGFPRTVPQAGALDRVLGGLHRSVDRVVVLEASESVLVKRLGGRRSCPACGAVYNVHFSPPEREGRCDRCGNDRLIQRADDAAETVRRRLEVYRSETEPLIRYYEEGQAPVDRIDGGRGADEVHAAIAANLAPGREAADPDIGALEIAS